MSGRSGPDRSNPEWAKPLAPLPDWLASVDQLLQSINDGNDQYDQPTHGSRSLSPCLEEEATSWQPFPSWKCRWRKRFSLTKAQAAEILGYDSVDEVSRLERANGVRTKRTRERQQALAEERWGEPITDRCSWLKAWRRRLGIPQWQAADILGYSHRNGISDIERRWSIPSWEKILLAIHAEQAL